MSERLLITKLVRDGDRADLFARGHQYRDLVLFDLSDLADVGVDYAALENGVETPVRFWAIYELSEKLNKNGNPYKDVIALEPVDKPATTTSTDSSAVLAELRAIRILVERIAGTIPGVVPAPLLTPEEETEDLSAHFPDEGEAEAPDADGNGDGPVAGAEVLLQRLNRETGGAFQSTGHLLYAIRKATRDDDWGWPITTDEAGWNEAAEQARAYLRQL